MLRVKGVSGGGSTGITNGVLADMYSADEEIAANTFVELIEYLHNDPDNPSLLLKGFSVAGSISSFPNKIVQLNDSKYLIFIERAVYLCIVNGATTSIVVSKDITTSSKYRFQDAIGFTNNAAIAIFQSDLGTGKLYYFGISVNQDNSLHVSTSREMSSNWYSSNARLAKLSDNAVIAVWFQTDSDDSAEPKNATMAARVLEGGTLYPVQTVAENLFETRPSVLKIEAVSESRIVCEILTSINSPSSPYQTFLLSFDRVSGEASSLVHADGMEQDLTNWHLVPIDDTRMLAVIENEDDYPYVSTEATIITLNGNSIQVGQSLRLLHGIVSPGIGGEGDAYEPIHVIKIAENKLCALVLHRRFNQTSSTTHSPILIEYQALFINAQPGDVPKKAGLSTLVTNSNHAAISDSAIFTEQNGDIVFSASTHDPYDLYFWFFQRGELKTVAQKSITKIEGLTKTKATPTEPGKVWMLDSSTGIKAKQISGVGVQTNESSTITPIYMED